MSTQARTIKTLLVFYDSLPPLKPLLKNSKKEQKIYLYKNGEKFRKFLSFPNLTT
jgi:hypothetical protein